jgi:hypothetical protein
VLLGKTREQKLHQIFITVPYIFFNFVLALTFIHFSMIRTFIKTIFINILFGLFLLEVSGFISIHYFNLGLPPGFVLKQNTPIVQDYNSLFGVWHPQNTQTRSIGPCWNVPYSFNSVGARDKERKLISDQQRFLLLGDSFFEGFGVPINRTFHQVLEQQTGIEFMPFAASGGFGPTQMQLMYDSLASNFDHTHLIVSLFVGNDFTDDDYEFQNALNHNEKRYKPYYENNNNSYSISYHDLKLEQSSWYYKNYSALSPSQVYLGTLNNQDSFLGKINQINKDFSYGRALVSTFVKKMNTLNIEQKEQVFFSELNSKYLQKYAYVLSKIRETAKGKKVIVLLIPNYAEVSKIKNNKNYNKLSPEVTKICKTLDFKLIDLTSDTSSPYFTENINLPCDGHWSVKGHEIVAGIIKTKLKEWQYLP